VKLRGGTEVVQFSAPAAEVARDRLSRPAGRRRRRAPRSLHL